MSKLNHHATDGKPSYYRTQAAERLGTEAERALRLLETQARARVVEAELRQEPGGARRLVITIVGPGIEGGAAFCAELDLVLPEPVWVTQSVRKESAAAEGAQ